MLLITERNSSQLCLLPLPLLLLTAGCVAASSTRQQQRGVPVSAALCVYVCVCWVRLNTVVHAGMCVFVCVCVTHRLLWLSSSAARQRRQLCLALLSNWSSTNVSSAERSRAECRSRYEGRREGSRPEAEASSYKLRLLRMRKTSSEHTHTCTRIQCTVLCSLSYTRTAPALAALLLLAYCSCCCFCCFSLGLRKCGSFLSLIRGSHKMATSLTKWRFDLPLLLDLNLIWVWTEFDLSLLCFCLPFGLLLLCFLFPLGFAFLLLLFYPSFPVLLLSFRFLFCFVCLLLLLFLI